MRNEAGFYVTRGLIGLLEGGFGPLTVMCLSDFYTNKELGFRIAILSSGINVSLPVQYDMAYRLTLQSARSQKLCPLYWLLACLPCEEWLASQVRYNHGYRSWLIANIV